MKYTKLYTLLTEVRNVYYKLPKDKQHQLFDFYMLEGLKQPSNYKLKRGYIEARKTITDSLVVELKNALLYALNAEFNHIFELNTPEEIIKDNRVTQSNVKTFIKDYHKNVFVQPLSDETTVKPGTTNDEMAKMVTKQSLLRNAKTYKGFTKLLQKYNVSSQQFIDLTKKAFKKSSWDMFFGGEEWKQISEAWEMLDKAKEFGDKVIAVDHAYDLQHNTDTVFNKLQSYYKEGFSWITKSLDKKAKIKNMWEIYKDISPPLKVLSAAIIKDTEQTTWDLFWKSKKKR